MWTGNEVEFSDNSAHIFHAAAIASGILGIYSLTLPRTEPPAKGEKISLGKVLGVDAWAMLGNPAFLIFALSSFSGLYPARRILQLRLHVCGQHGCAAVWIHDRSHEYRADERDLFHVDHAALFRASRREENADPRDVGLGLTLRDCGGTRSVRNPDRPCSPCPSS